MSLNTELQNKLLSEISKYSQSIEETDTSQMHHMEIDAILLQEYDAYVEKNVIQQLSNLHNPFLIKAMENYMPSKLYVDDTVDAHISNIRNCKTKENQLNNLHEKYNIHE